MVNTRYIGKLQQKLLRAAATEATLVSKPRRSGAPMQFIRSGPFTNAQAARRRLRELAPVMASLQLRPIIITGPVSLNAPAHFEMASTVGSVRDAAAIPGTSNPSGASSARVARFRDSEF
jgi:hypothetical protein